MDPSVQDHIISFPNFVIHNTLFLHGVNSYLSASKPSLAALEGKYEIYLMNSEDIWKPGSDAYPKIEEIIMDWEKSIKYKQYRIQVMLEVVELDKSVVSSATIISRKMEVIDNIFEVIEPVLHRSEKATPMYGAIPEEFYDLKKLMGEVSSFIQ